MLQLLEKQRQGRRAWMGLLARAPLEMLEAWHARADPPAHSWLRRPETGLAMVRARAGGTGEKFNFGEITLTRCAVRLESGECGVAYVQGRSHRRAELAALADAMLQSARSRDTDQNLVGPLRERLEREAATRQRKAQATRVEFFTLAREAAREAEQ
ncbi:MAG TPA: phosphonate C-P lyase system protein PhnG [Burkholderiales bacterium]|nr:phosphonate C-P lyase system protein PhnG [Burkholderiales bacterium]